VSAHVEVLLLSSLADLSTDRICHHLTDMGVSFLRINNEQLPDLGITIDPVAATMLCRFASKQWHVGSSLKSVWWRQPTFLRNTPGRSLSTTQQLEKSQWAAMMRGMMLFDSAHWFNHPMKTYGAESKPVQLRKAAQAGFLVPNTRITNDSLANIPSVIGNRIALKSIDTVLLFEADHQHFGYTTIVDWTACADEAFHTVPATIQAVISPKIDLRVTVLGQHLWCVQITDGGDGIEGDWRLRSKAALQFRDYQLPPDVATRCLALVANLELRYAAIDLALSGDDYWFIEVNPTGEWGWLDRGARRISKTIAGELACPI
jgi:hypothetical protein